jgi:hypothetical protein
MNDAGRDVNRLMNFVLVCELAAFVSMSLCIGLILWGVVPILERGLFELMVSSGIGLVSIRLFAKYVAGHKAVYLVLCMLFVCVFIAALAKAVFDIIVVLL